MNPVKISAIRSDGTCQAVESVSKLMSEKIDSLSVFAPPSVDLSADLQSACREQVTSSITIWPVHSGDEWSEDWATLPASVAARIQSPSGSLMIVPTSLVAPLQKDECDPGWDVLIRSVDAGTPVRVESAPIEIPTTSDSSSLPRLAPQQPSRDWDWLRDHLTQPLPGVTRSTVDTTAVTAGLLQMHDWLETSHEYSQSIEGKGSHRAGDYWHGIMHRREPDYGNAKYWFRRVGVHPVFAQLAPRADAQLADCADPQASAWRSLLMTSSGWDPFAFIDLCEECAVDEDAPLAMAARRIQWLEMRLLLHQTVRDALAG